MVDVAFEVEILFPFLFPGFRDADFGDLTGVDQIVRVSVETHVQPVVELCHPDGIDVYEFFHV